MNSLNSTPSEESDSEMDERLRLPRRDTELLVEYCHNPFGIVILLSFVPFNEIRRIVCLLHEANLRSRVKKRCINVDKGVFRFVVALLELASHLGRLSAPTYRDLRVTWIMRIFSGMVSVHKNGSIQRIDTNLN